MTRPDHDEPGPDAFVIRVENATGHRAKGIVSRAELTAYEGDPAKLVAAKARGLADVLALATATTEPDAPVRRLTTDPTDPRLGHGFDSEPIPQHDVYLVLDEEELAKGYVRPYRDTYRHLQCPVNPQATTRMGIALSQTYARDPKFYGSTYCVACRMHKPVGEFVWDKDGKVVGS